MWLRRLLRWLIGWDELKTEFASANSVSELKSRQEAQNLDIEGLRTRLRTEKVHTTVKMADWDTVQNQFASDPENFKEK